MQQVAAISAMKNGEMGVFVMDRKVTVLQVVASQEQPLDEAKATPYIEQFLTARKRDELARAEVKRLRESAKIEYVGEFAKLGDAAAAAVAAPAPAADTTATAAPAAVVAKDTAVDKGVAGLR